MTREENWQRRMAEGATVAPNTYEYEEEFIDAMCDADFRRMWGDPTYGVTLQEVLELHAEIANAVHIPMWHELKAQATTCAP